MNAAVKRLDVICIGRVAVDLYAQQIGAARRCCQFR
jgi:5-dehydro-2-deoxygluconokinase